MSSNIADAIESIPIPTAKCVFDKNLLVRETNLKTNMQSNACVFQESMPTAEYVSDKNLLVRETNLKTNMQSDTSVFQVFTTTTEYVFDKNLVRETNLYMQSNTSVFEGSTTTTVHNFDKNLLERETDLNTQSNTCDLQESTTTTGSGSTSISTTSQTKTSMISYHPVVVNAPLEYIFDKNLLARETDLKAHMLTKYNLEFTGTLLPKVKASVRLVDIVEQTEPFLAQIPSNNEFLYQIGKDMAVVKDHLIPQRLMEMDTNSKLKIDKVPEYEKIKNHLNGAISVLKHHDPELVQLLEFHTDIDEVLFIVNAIFQIFWVAVNNPDVMVAGAATTAFVGSAMTVPPTIAFLQTREAATGAFVYTRDLDKERQEAFRRDIGIIGTLIGEILFSVVRLLLQLVATFLIRIPLYAYVCCLAIYTIHMGGNDYNAALLRVQLICASLERSINCIPHG
jgi:hypothetical protein